MESITTGITAMVGVASTMLTEILSNPVFAALFSVGFISIGIKLVRKLKHV